MRNFWKLIESFKLLFHQDYYLYQITKMFQQKGHQIQQIILFFIISLVLLKATENEIFSKYTICFFIIANGFMKIQCSTFFISIILTIHQISLIFYPKHYEIQQIILLMVISNIFDYGFHLQHKQVMKQSILHKIIVDIVSFQMLFVLIPIFSKHKAFMFIQVILIFLLLEAQTITFNFYEKQVQGGGINLAINVNAKPLILLQIILLIIVLMDFPYHTQVIILSILLEQQKALLKPKNSNVISPRYLLALLENSVKTGIRGLLEPVSNVEILEKCGNGLVFVIQYEINKIHFKTTKADSKLKMNNENVCIM